MLFPEGANLEQYKRFVDETHVPILADLEESTYTATELAQVCEHARYTVHMQDTLHVVKFTPVYRFIKASKS